MMHITQDASEGYDSTSHPLVGQKTAWLDTKKSRKNLKLLGNDANLFIEKPQ